jgi:ribonucleoside-diphosphate reductase alpha chain
MKIERRYTVEGQDAYTGIDFRNAVSEIKNPDGSIVFRLADIEVPSSWSQVATDILAQKYFRKAGIPKALKKVEEETMPSWLWRSVMDEDALAGVPDKDRITGERSAKQVFNRLAGTWTYWGLEGQIFRHGKRRSRLL